MQSYSYPISCQNVCNNQGTEYIVQSGDTLWKLAIEFYGDPKLHDIIYEANKNIIKDHNLIYSGQKIIIPPHPSQTPDNGLTALSSALPPITEFRHAVVCALPKERLAVVASLDLVFKERHPKSGNDDNVYTLGMMINRNNPNPKKFPVVVCSLPTGEYGTVSASSCATNLMMAYTEVEFIFMVGIAGACPDIKKQSHGLDIRLGDVVVSSSVLQYDLGRMEGNGKFSSNGHLDRPSRYFSNLWSKLEEQLKMKESKLQLQIRLSAYVKAIIENLDGEIGKIYGRPHPDSDHLFQSDFLHPTEANNCETCIGQKPTQEVERPARVDSNYFRVFNGRIGCGNAVIKNSEFRDKLTKDESILCFEMEAAGITQKAKYLVIRGICDYSDSHKNKEWQEYAAATSAAVFKALMKESE